MTLKRMSFMQHLMAFMGLAGRLHLEWISSAEAQKFVTVVTGFTETIRRLGPSPLKTVSLRPPVGGLAALPENACGVLAEAPISQGTDAAAPIANG
jgi:hypothetical protein